MKTNTLGQKKMLRVTAFLLPTLIVFCVLFMVPLVITIYSSFTKWDGMGTMEFIGISNYTQLFKDANFMASIKNTLIWAAFSIFVHVPFGVIVALILNHKRKGWKIVRSCFMIPNVISKSALALLFVFIYKPDVGILNSFLAKVGLESWQRNWLVDESTAFLSVTNIWLWFAGLIVLMTLAELMAVPEEVSEAARIDGATRMQIDWYIYLPLIRRIIGTSIIVAVTASFQQFDVIYMTTNGGPGNSTMNLSVMMVDKITNVSQYGYANAIGVILLILGMVTMGVCNKLFAMDKE